MIEVTKHALVITSFVLIMMLLIEYINVQTKGSWQESLQKKPIGQYILGSMLGVTPGCLGAFMVVSLYSHRAVSFGALVATMIATSGDEAFVMFSMFPLQALYLSVILFSVAIAGGWIADRIFNKQEQFLMHEDHELQVHEPELCCCISSKDIWPQLRQPTLPRAVLIILVSALLFALLNGVLVSTNWDWKKIIFTLGAGFSLFVVSTATDHFLEQHLWEHVIKKHLLKVFLWTFAALFTIHYLDTWLDIGTLIQDNLYVVLIIAVLVGIIPESGPHMVFVTLFAQGTIPFTILLASSIVQDGHGTLPLLAVSRGAFIWLKVVNVIIGLLLGLIGLYFFN